MLTSPARKNIFDALDGVIIIVVGLANFQSRAEVVPLLAEKVFASIICRRKKIPAHVNGEIF